MLIDHKLVSRAVLYSIHFGYLVLGSFSYLTVIWSIKFQIINLKKNSYEIGSFIAKITELNTFKVL